MLEGRKSSAEKQITLRRPVTRRNFSDVNEHIGDDALIFDPQVIAAANPVSGEYFNAQRNLHTTSSFNDQ